MSTDRELLVLAAKSIGGTFDHGTDCITMDGIEYEQWNPLTDDGDALRLAVNLGIEFRFRLDQGYCVVAMQSDFLRSRFKKDANSVIVNYVPERQFKSNDADEVSHARYLVDTRGKVRGVKAATRIAIVRAAAEIGKAMP